jgi:hypothetical protein
MLRPANWPRLEDTMTQTIALSVHDEAARHGRGDAQAGLARRSEADLTALLRDAGLTLSRKDQPTAFARYCEAYDTRASREKLVDAGSEMSFPASDPPSYMGGASAGAPEPEAPGEAPNTTVSDTHNLKEIDPTGGAEKKPKR